MKYARWLGQQIAELDRLDADPRDPLQDAYDLAELIDEAGRPIGPHAFAAINEQLNLLYRSLASRELAAGSVAARRLFS